MGKTSKKDSNITNKFFIDYANSEFRSDLMDIYLASNCVFEWVEELVQKVLH